MGRAKQGTVSEAQRAARSKGGKTGWTPERRAKAKKAVAAARERKQQLKRQRESEPNPPETSFGVEDPELGRRTCLEWLNREGITAHERECLIPNLQAPAPKDPVTNVRYRLAVWEKAAKDEAFRKAIFARCTGAGLTDVKALVWFADTFIWQNNLALKGKEVGPFITWDYQERAAKVTLESLLGESDTWEREDLAWEKSRELGATVWMLVISVWMCTAHRYKRVLALSHSEEAVTKSGDEDTLFGKVEFFHARMPPWLLRGAFKRRKGFRYPGTGSQITGAASTGRSGVGGRVTLVLLDEFSKQREAESIWQQTASTGPRLVCGTHYGAGGQFFDLTQGKQRLRKVVMHWSEHPVFGRGKYRAENGRPVILDPDYVYPPQCPECSRLQKVPVGEPTPCCEVPARPFYFVLDGRPLGGAYPGLRSPWYDRECVRRNDDRNTAMNLDIDPRGSVSQVFNPMVIRKLRAEARPPVWEGDIAHGELVARPGGPLKLWVHPTVQGFLPAGRYGAGCDISQGTGSTPSCLAAFDATLCQRTAEYSNARINAYDFADLAVVLCGLLKDKFGRPALLGWESNGPGIQFGQKVLELGYSNVYNGTDELPRAYAIKPRDNPGWRANPQSIQTLIENYRAGLANGDLAEFSDRTLEECLDYRYNQTGVPEHPGKKAKADPSGAAINHGDRVTAAALGWKMVKELGTGRRTKADEPRDPPAGSWLWRRQEADRADREKEVWA